MKDLFFWDGDMNCNYDEMILSGFVKDTHKQKKKLTKLHSKIILIYYFSINKTVNKLQNDSFKSIQELYLIQAFSM